nr:NADH dehydrogenase subunit 5 [Nidirana daunchina]
MNLLIKMSLPLLTVLALISRPLLNTQSPTFFLQAKNAVKMAFFVSLAPFLTFLLETPPTVMTTKCFYMEKVLLPFSFQYDLYTTIFLPVAFLVTWSILEYSIWYMQIDPKINVFFKYLLMFLLAMILLVTAGNLFLLFLGWEGVGFMSFMLIGWYHGRSHAATAALQAVLYNRAGDIGFMMTVCWLLMNTSSLTLPHVLSLFPSTALLLGFISAAASKSAQFGFHPWLASAMEGPTPVSALLHSSTMVVAGIFLLIRIHPLLARNSTALTICLCLGAISTLYAAYYAFIQNDIKKIIAYSTSSQLGLMMVAIGLNLPYLAFFHICTHAFFKAMLFLCSGLIIHALNEEQDIRKMGGLQHALPVTTTCLSIGSFALMGTPFLAGFYSKDAIIEASATSPVNFLALLLTLVATAFTAFYSMRMIYHASMKYPRTKPILLYDENDNRVLYPLLRLVTGSIVTGLFVYLTTFPDVPTTHTMPTYIKMFALVVTFIAFATAYDLAETHWSTPPKDITLPMECDPTFHEKLLHRTITEVTLDSAWQVITHAFESILLKKLNSGPSQIYQSLPIQVTRISQTGLIKTYLSILFITLFFVVCIVRFF